MAWEISSIACAASGPVAVTVIFSAFATARPMIDMIDFAFAESSPRRSRMSDLKPLARFTSVADGRACRPVGFGTRIASDVTVLPPDAAASPSSCSASTTSAATSLPAVTRPVLGVSEATMSEFAMTVCVRTLFACVATTSRSNSMSSSPTST